MEILDPRVTVAAGTAPPARALGRPVRGAVVGLRLDQTWRSYQIIVDEWQRRLARDGATVEILCTGERIGPPGDKTRSDLEEWSRLVDCGVVGLGN